MNDKLLHILLSTIERERSLKGLRNQGLSLKEIADLGIEAIEKGWLDDSEKEVSLTANGRKLLEEFRRQLKRKPSHDWINKDAKFIIPKLEKDFIYLPDQTDLNLG